MIRRFALAAVAAATLAVASPRADAIILTRSATRNTTAPWGGLTNSGWQWEGNFGSFLGTPIAKNYFITAEHIGGNVGQTFTLNGKTYNTVARYDDPSTDLRIYKTSQSFTSWAPIYTGSSETGKMMSLYGRGTQRGASVTENNQLKGWKWGTADHVKSWGRNAVAGVTAGGSGRGDLLRFTFNRSGGDYYESALSTGDSGGAVFLKDSDGKWKLTGINYLVDGPFSTTGTNGSGFNMSAMDKGGLYVGGDNAWKYNSETSADNPGNFYATRVSRRAAWIRSIIGASSSPSSVSGVTAVPEPATLGLIAGAGALLLGRRRRRR